MKFVITTSPGNSGAGALHDYLLSRNDFLSPFQGEEFRLICDPYGIENLYQKLITEFSNNNSAEGFYQFEKYCENLRFLKVGKSSKLIYGKKFYQITKQYLKNITLVKYRGIPQFKRISLSKFDTINFKVKKKFFRLKNYDHKFYTMKIPIEKKKFIVETQKYLIKIIQSNLRNVKNKNIILDQATNFWKPEIAFKYFDNLKIIALTRDPRSVYYSMKLRESFSYPGYNLKKFVIWYKSIIEKKISLKEKYKKHIIFIKFEDFALNFEKEKKKIEKFLGLKPKINNNFDYNFTRNNAYKAKKYLSKKELSFIEKNLKEHLQW